MLRGHVVYFAFKTVTVVFLVTISVSLPEMTVTNSYFDYAIVAVGLKLRTFLQVSSSFCVVKIHVILRGNCNSLFVCSNSSFTLGQNKN